MTRFFSVMAVALLLLCVSQRAMADCLLPTARAGTIIYNHDQNVPQVCADTVWTALGPLNPGASGTACTGPDRGEGAILYNVGNKVLQYCNGANWIAVMGASQSDSKREGYFVLSETKWRSNLGNLAGADTKCLTELTTKNWAGKADALAAVCWWRVK